MTFADGSRYDGRFDKDRMVDSSLGEQAVVRGWVDTGDKKTMMQTKMTGVATQQNFAMNKTGMSGKTLPLTTMSPGGDVTRKGKELEQNPYK